MNCQFYKPINREFRVSSYRKGKTIVCECCDYTEDEAEEQTEEETSKNNGDDKEKVVIRAGWFGKGKNSLGQFPKLKSFEIFISGYRKIQKKRKKKS